MRRGSVIILFFLLTYAGCVYDYPVLSDKFSAIQKQTLSAHCSSSSCHGDGTKGPFLWLRADSAYNQLLFNHQISNDSARSLNFRVLVVPYKPESSFLVTKLTLDESNGFGELMPSRHERLPQAQIDAIISWIKRGAPND